ETDEAKPSEMPSIRIPMARLRETVSPLRLAHDGQPRTVPSVAAYPATKAWRHSLGAPRSHIGMLLPAAPEPKFSRIQRARARPWTWTFTTVRSRDSVVDNSSASSLAVTSTRLLSFRP